MMRLICGLDADIAVLAACVINLRFASFSSDQIIKKR